MDATQRTTIRLGVVQTPGTRLDQWRDTKTLIEDLASRAARAGAELILFPECVWPAYYIESVESYRRARAAGLPGPDEFLEWIRAVAVREKVALCVGHVAEREGALRNEVALISSAGKLFGAHAKCFLWEFDNVFFEPGQYLRPIDTPWGPIGLMICADARLPEIPATLVTRGARLLLQPTAWVNVGTPDAPWNPQPAILIPDRAREFGVPIASASKWGAEGATAFVGSSLICDASGSVLKRCGHDRTELIVAEVTLGETRGASVTEAERERLLSAEPARAPRADVPMLRIVHVRGRTTDVAAARTGPRPSKGAYEPTLVIAEGDPGRPIGVQGDMTLIGPADGFRELCGVRIASLTDADARRFAGIRSAALEGVHVAVIFGDDVAAGTLRTRAAENRLFIIHAGTKHAKAYSPLGIEFEPSFAEARGAAEITTFHLDASSAAKKEFAPRTDPFHQRRPAMYDFG